MDIQKLTRKARRTNMVHCTVERVRFPMRIDAFTSEMIYEIAKENNISVNLLINAILEEFVDNHTTQ